MNIFALSNDPVTAAKYHVDKHVVKMILEYCQLLSTAHRVLDGTPRKVLSATGRSVTRYVIPQGDDLLYTATHVNHPSAVWVRQSSQNYIWLCELLIELCKEYTFRYGRVHLSEQKGLPLWFYNNIPKNIGKSKFSMPTPAMPDEYKVKGNVVQSYQNYYNGAKTALHSWKGKVNSRQQPEWIGECNGT